MGPTVSQLGTAGMSDEGRLWQVINEIREKVVSIEAGLNERCAYRESRICALESQIKAKADTEPFDDIERRVRHIEHRLWFAVGAASVLSSVGTVVVAVLIRRWIG